MLTVKRRRVKKTDAERRVDRALGRLMRAIQMATDHQVPAVMDSFQRMLLPLTFNMLIDKLLDAVKSKDIVKRQRAAAALVAIGAPAVDKISLRCGRNEDAEYQQQLIEVLGATLENGRSALKPLFLWATFSPDQVMRDAAQAALEKRGIQVPNGAREGETVDVFPLTFYATCGEVSGS